MGFSNYGRKRVVIGILINLEKRDESKVDNLGCNNKVGKHNKFL